MEISVYQKYFLIILYIKIWYSEEDLNFNGIRVQSF